MSFNLFPTALGRTIRLLREVRGVSLETMAGHHGMTKSGWSRVETGATEICASRLMKTAMFLRLPAWQVVKEAEDLIRTIGRFDDLAKKQDDQDKKENT